MKILVIGDIVVSCDLLVEAAKSLPGGEHEVVAVEWKSETRQKFQKKALNIEKNGPTAEEPPKEAYEQIGDADILLSHFCPIPEDLIEAGKNLKLIGTCRGGMEHVDIAAATKRNIPVIHCIRNAEATSDFAVGLMICRDKKYCSCTCGCKTGSMEKRICE